MEPVSTKVAVVVAPAVGPAVVTFFGLDIPILALAISFISLLLARKIAPPPKRKLGKSEDIALTILLVIILVLAVTGQVTGEPLGVGMAFVWAVGLGFSGILIVEAFGQRVRQLVDIWIGREPPKEEDEQ